MLAKKKEELSAYVQLKRLYWLTYQVSCTSVDLKRVRNVAMVRPIQQNGDTGIVMTSFYKVPSQGDNDTRRTNKDQLFRLQQFTSLSRKP